MALTHSEPDFCPVYAMGGLIMICTIQGMSLGLERWAPLLHLSLLPRSRKMPFSPKLWKRGWWSCIHWSQVLRRFCEFCMPSVVGQAFFLWFFWLNTEKLPMGGNSATSRPPQIQRRIIAVTGGAAMIFKWGNKFGHKGLMHTRSTRHYQMLEDASLLGWTSAELFQHTCGFHQCMQWIRVIIATSRHLSMHKIKNLISKLCTWLAIPNPYKNCLFQYQSVEGSQPGKTAFLVLPESRGASLLNVSTSSHLI